MPTRAPTDGRLRFYRMADDDLAPTAQSGDLVVVDPDRAAHEGDLVALERDHAVLVGHLVQGAADRLLTGPRRPPVPLDGQALLGVVALVVSAV